MFSDDGDCLYYESEEVLKQFVANMTTGIQNEGVGQNNRLGGEKAKAHNGQTLGLSGEPISPAVGCKSQSRCKYIPLPGSHKLSGEKDMLNIPKGFNPEGLYVGY